MEEGEGDKIVENRIETDPESSMEIDSSKSRENSMDIDTGDDSGEQADTTNKASDLEKHCESDKVLESDEKVEDFESDANKNKKRKISDTKSEDFKKENAGKVTSDEKEVSQETKDEPPQEVNIPPKQTPDLNLGKGKRARIPNKRYSDILLSPPSRTSYKSSLSLENGEKSLPTEPEFDLEEINRNNSPAVKKTKLQDIKNPNYLKPFKYGWKRELVYRANTDSQNRRIPGDIYYYTPQGKKVKSFRELGEILLKVKELTVDDFTFTKESLGLDDPEKEILRDAKTSGKKSSSKSKSAKVLSPKLSPTKQKRAESPKSKPKATPKAKSGKNATSKKGKEDENPEVQISHNSRPKRKAPRKGSLEGVMEGKSPPCQPCSIRCLGVLGRVPTLQCRVCLCLYHNECVGLAPHLQIDAYVCKNCHLDHGQSDAQSLTKQSNIQLPPLPPLPSTLQTSSINSQQQAACSSSGSVESWIPDIASLYFKSRNQNVSIKGAERPQYVEYMAGRRFLIIPKSLESDDSDTPSSNNNNISNSEQACDLQISSEPTTSGGYTESENVLEVIALGNLRLKDNENLEDNQNLENSENLEDTQNLEDKLKIEDNQELKCNSKNTEDAMIIEVCDSDDAGGRNDQQVYSPDSSPTSASNKRRLTDQTQSERKSVEERPAPDYFQSLSYGYSALRHIFQYLKVQDILSCKRTCRMWYDVASHPSLWRTVRMKNSQLHSFEGLVKSLKKHGTVHLDLRKMLLPAADDEIWNEFSDSIKIVDTLRRIELSRCPAFVVEQLPLSCPDLEVLNAVTIKSDKLDLGNMKEFRCLKELRLKSISGFTLTSDLKPLEDWRSLRVFSLTSVKDLEKVDLSVLGNFRHLESLDLGECTNFPKTFAEILSKFEKLEKLRLEKGPESCGTFEILEAVSKLPNLQQLELVNFDIKAGFDVALGKCKNIKKLLLIPTYISQSSTTNHLVLGGVLRMHKNLTYFVWGVTLELLRVTELFIDQCEDPVKKSANVKEKKLTLESIPILKPVPILKKDEDIPPPADPPQVEILTLTNLQKLLQQSLPNSKVKILKIPFHATWRQTIADNV